MPNGFIAQNLQKKGLKTEKSGQQHRILNVGNSLGTKLFGRN